MKKSKFKRVIALITAVIMCFGMSTLTFAASLSEGETISPKNIAITATDNSLGWVSTGKLNCYGSTDVQSGYKAGVTVELQRYSSGWSTIKTWSSTGGLTAIVDKDYYVSTGYSYRLKLTHRAYDSSGTTVIETIVKYSNVVS